MKMFIWNDFGIFYGSGCMMAYADDTVEARKQIAKAILEGTEHADNFIGIIAEITHALCLDPYKFRDPPSNHKIPYEVLERQCDECEKALDHIEDEYKLSSKDMDALTSLCGKPPIEAEIKEFAFYKYWQR